MATKPVPVYFYYINMRVAKLKDNLLTPYLEDVVFFLQEALQDLLKQTVKERKTDYKGEKRVVWIDTAKFDSKYKKNDPKKLDSWSADIVMKSAKYDQIRSVIDTDTMLENIDKRKSEKDGDEEKTHFCLRYYKNRDFVLCVEEFNYYGIRIGKLVSYLNERIENYREKLSGNYSYSFQSEIMPCNAFLEELRKMKSINLVTLGVARKSITNQFMEYANRGDVCDTVDIVLKPDKQTKQERKYVRKSTVKAYFDGMQKNSDITRITAVGRNQNGNFTLDTESMKTKQSIKVKVTEFTHEVKDSSFFLQAQAMLERMKQDENCVSGDADSNT